jgi:hypothetical protein
MTSINTARARDWFEQIWNQRRIDLIETFAGPNSIAHLESGMTWMRFEGGAIAEGWDSWNQGGLLEELRSARSEVEG